MARALYVVGFLLVLAGLIASLLPGSLWGLTSAIANFGAIVCVIILVFVNRGMPYGRLGGVAGWSLAVIAIGFVVASYFNLTSFGRPSHHYWASWQPLLLAGGLLLQQATRIKKIETVS